MTSKTDFHVGNDLGVVRALSGGQDGPVSAGLCGHPGRRTIQELGRVGNMEPTGWAERQHGCGVGNGMDTATLKGAGTRRDKEVPGSCGNPSGLHRLSGGAPAMHMGSAGAKRAAGQPVYKPIPQSS